MSAVLIKALSAVTLGLVWTASFGQARAAAVEPARVRVSAALIDEVVRGLLPIDVVLPGPMSGGADGGAGPAPVPALLTEVRYCGATDKGAGRFRAVIRWGSPGPSSPPVLAGDDGCRQSLGGLGKQLPAPAGTDDGVAVVDLEAIWRPWELRLSVVRALGPAPPVPPRPGPPRPLVGLDGRRDLVSVSTAGFRVVTDTGETITFHLAPSFGGDGIEAAAVVGEGGSGPPSSRLATSGTGPPLIPGANVVADLPFAVSNQILRQVTGRQALPVPVDRDVVDVQNVSVAGVTGGVALLGTATPRSLRETARVTAQAGGPDLRVWSIRAEAQLENCAGLSVLPSISCKTRNAARAAAAEAFGATMTQKYQNRLVRELAGPQVLRWDVGSRRLELRGNLVHLGPNGRGLTVGARLTSGDGGSSAR